MPDEFRFYQLIIRDPTDAFDDIVITSSPYSGTNLLEEPPTGDGQKLDPLEGRVDIGAYSYKIIDTGDPGVNKITEKLFDALGRPQVLSRRAYGRYGTDGVNFPNLQVAGYVNNCSQVDEGLFDITIGESRRIEQTFTAFRSLLVTNAAGVETVSQFDRYTSILGGPVRGGFGPVADHGGWKMRVDGKYAGTNLLRMERIEGWVPKAEGYVFHKGKTDLGEFLRIARYTNPYRVDTTQFAALQVKDIYPKLRYHVFDLAGNSLGYYMPTGLPPTSSGYGGVFRHNAIGMIWNGAPPANGTLVTVYLYAVDIGPDNPLHIFDHPVNVVSKAYQDAGIAVDTASVTTTINAIGADIRILLRILEAAKLAEFERPLMGFFGFGTRINQVTGARVFFPTRVRGNAVPVTVVTENQLRYPPRYFDIDEATVVNRVIVSQIRYEQWVKDEETRVEYTPDYLVEVPQTREYDNGDVSAFGERAIEYKLPGTVQTITGASGNVQFSGADVPIDGFATAIAREIFDRWGRGAIEGMIPADDTIVEQVGDEVVLNLAAQPRANVRGGLHTVQVVQRTQQPDGPDLAWVSSGSTNQVGVAPTIAIAPNADLPRSVIDVTLTNPGAFGAGVVVRFEWGFGVVAPTGAGMPLNSLRVGTDPNSFRTPRTNAGSIVWIRAQATEQGKRPSLWSAWHGLDLANIPAIWGMAATAIDATTVRFNWNNGVTDLPVHVYLRDATSGETTVASAKRIAVLPPGSIEYTVSGLIPGSQYYVWAIHVEDLPFSGQSDPSGEAGYLAGGVAPGLSAPQNPRAFAGAVNVLPTLSIGRGSKSTTTIFKLGRETSGVVADGTFGMDVSATVFPSEVEFEVAVETAIGSGVPGAFAFADSEPSVQGGKTVFMSIAPADRLKRWMRARHAAPGKTPSAYTPTVGPIDPWTLTKPVDYPITVPAGIVGTVIYTTGDRGEQARIRLAFTPPSDLHFKRMEWQLKSRIPGSIDWSGATVVTGTREGPDDIGVDFALEYLINPITVTENDVRNIGPSIPVVTVASRLDPTPTFGTPVATSGYIEYSVVGYDDETKRIEVWSINSAGAPADVSVEKATGAVRFEDFNKGDGRLTIQLPVSVGLPWRNTTFVPYDKDGNRGPITRFQTQRATPVPPAAPGAWATFSNPNPFTGSITRRVTLAGSAVAGWKLRTYRAGSIYGVDRTLSGGDIAAGYVDVVDSGVSASSTYYYKDSHIDLASVEGATNAENSLTTFAPAGPSVPGGFVNNDDDCEDHLVWTANGNPSGTTYKVYRSTTGSGGSYSQIFSQIDTFALDVSKHASAIAWYKVLASKSGSSSAFAGPVSGPPRDPGCML